MLTPQEARELFEIIRSLTAQGKSIIFISHKLNEVTEIADRITVLRRGKLIETLPAEGATEEGLARLMVGRDVLLRVDKTAVAPGRDAASASRTCTSSTTAEIEKVRGVSFEVRAGEIVGIAGIDGNGQTELIDAMTGLRKIAAGTVTSTARTSRTTASTTTSRRGSAISRRTGSGAGSCSSSRSPRTSPSTTTASSRTRGSAGCSRGRLIDRARRLIKEFDVRGGGPPTPGGRPLGRQPAEGRARARDRPQPARPDRRAADAGLDVGAIEFVHRRLVEERDEGRAILLVSLELEEILSLSDRILVMYEGEIVGEFPPTATEEELGVAMTGGGRGKEVAA